MTLKSLCQLIKILTVPGADCLYCAQINSFKFNVASMCTEGLFDAVI